MIINNAKVEMRGLLRLGLDTRNTALAEGTGVAGYAEMLGRIAAENGFTPQWLTAGAPVGKYRRFCRAMQRHQRVDGDFSAPDIFRVAQEHFNLYRRPLALFSENPPQLMHWTYPLPLCIKNTRNIITIHDLIPLSMPGLSVINGPRLRRLLNILVRNADGIVTVSESARADIIGQLGVSPKRVKNLYQGIDTTALTAEQLSKANVLCPAGSFVVVGRVEPRKNIARLIAAHAASGVSEQLVIIGPDGEGSAAVLAGAGDKVMRVPYAARKDLLHAMVQARAVLFPSLAEGFGLPIAEAFALGTPVMTSKGGATEEIAGGAALLVNPYDIDDMARAIALLAGNGEVCRTLSAAGTVRSDLFTPRSYAARVRDYYETILNPQLGHPI